jgi:hypothetical protein
VERVQRRLTSAAPDAFRAATAGRAALRTAGLLMLVAIALVACNSTDTRIRVGGGVSATYGVTTTSGILKQD